MTSQNNTEQMLAPYIDSVEPPSFLSSMFRVPPGGIHMADKVSLDTVSGSRKIAWPTSINGWHFNERNGFSNKEWTPAVVKEAFSIGANDLMDQRSIGQNPFVSPVFGSRAQAELNRMLSELQRRINGMMELMASQIMTTGAISLVDDTAAVRFAETFGARTAHFPNAATSWSTSATAVPLTDIKNLCDLIVRNGRRTPRRVIMNSTTFGEFITCTTVLDALSNQRNLWQGEFGPQPVGSDAMGGVMQGRIKAGPYTLEIWTYDGVYELPQTPGTETQYVPDGKWIVESGGRMDATFGGIANFGTDGRANRYFARVTNASMQSDMSIVTWVSGDGTAINVGVGSRPLLIPAAVDTFGCGDADAA